MAFESIDSLTSLLATQETYGAFGRLSAQLISTATTAATVDSGHISAQRYPAALTVPSVDTTSPAPALTGYWMDASMDSEDQQTIYLMALEVSFGSYNHATNTFTDGSAMPTRSIRIDGTTYTEQTAAMLTAIVPTTVHAATAWVGTITYTDEGGTGSRVTSAITVPASAAVNSAFMFHSKMVSGTLGIRDITAITRTSGPATGVDSIYGLIPLAWSFNQSTLMAGSQVSNLLRMSSNIVIPQPGDTIAFYRFGGTTTSELTAQVLGRPV